MRTHFAVFFYFLDVLYRSEMCENNCDKRQQKFRSSTFRFVSLTPLTVVVAADDDDEMTSLQVSMPTWKLGEAVCKLVPMVAGTNVFVSTLSITAIALDRFHLIVHPTDKDHLCRNNVKKNNFLTGQIRILQCYIFCQFHYNILLFDSEITETL